MLIPWGHTISYSPDAAHPYLVNGVHLISAHQSQPIIYNVAHSDEHPLAANPWREDIAISGWDQVITGSMINFPGLRYLTEYIVIWFQRREWHDADARRLGGILLSEIMPILATPLPHPDLPAMLEEVIEYIQAHLPERFTIADLSQLAGCSATTLTRQFRHYLHQSPLEWIIHTRLRQAANLIVTTHLPIGIIGRQVGFDDPYYFSKLYKQVYGESPKHYRNRMAITMHI